MDEVSILDGSTALHVAVAYQHKDVVTALLALKSVDVNAAALSGYTPLHMAAESGSSQIVKALLHSAEVHVNARLPETRETPILLALEKGHYKVVHRLMNDPRIDLNATRASDGNTLLHLAVEAGEMSLVTALLAREAVDTNAFNTDGKSALHVSVESGRKFVVAEMVNCPQVDINCQDAKEGNTALHFVALSGGVDVARILLAKEGVHINTTRKDGLTAMDLAILQEIYSENCVNSTFPLEISSARSSSRTSPLRQASKSEGREKEEMIRTPSRSVPRSSTRKRGSRNSIERPGDSRDSRRGSDVQRSSVSFNISAHLEDSRRRGMSVESARNSRAIRKSNQNTLRLTNSGRLYQEGQETFISTNIAEHFRVMSMTTGSVASSLANFRGVESVVKLLVLRPDLKINVTSPHKRALLHAAVREGAAGVVQQLLPHCAAADFQYNVKKRQTLLHPAARRGHVEVVKLLLQHTDIDVNCTAKDGSTPLHLAAKEGHLEVVQELLLVPTIDVNLTYQNGWTSLCIAKKFDHTDVVELLHKHKVKHRRGMKGSIQRLMSTSSTNLPSPIVPKKSLFLCLRGNSTNDPL